MATRSAGAKGLGVKAHRSENASSSKKANDLATLALDVVMTKLDTSAAGLTSAQAKKRLVDYGANEIAEVKQNAMLKFLSYFWGPFQGSFDTGPTSVSSWCCSWPTP